MGSIDAVAEPLVGFHKRLDSKIREQLASRRVGYLLGAGSSFLNGQGYPLASHLWSTINSLVPEPHKSEIQRALDECSNDLEDALDSLDNNQFRLVEHRDLVTKAIAEHFRTIEPPLESHIRFLSRLAGKLEHTIHLFNLNYDPLVELASDQARVYLVDGFRGIEHPYFDPKLLQFSIGVIQRGLRAQVFRSVAGVIHHYKLHGSLGWYEGPKDGIRRCGVKTEIPVGAKRLMVPPQSRKVTDTLASPYEGLWSDFRRLLRHGPFPLNRLVVIGYGMRDSHINMVIESALARPDFTLLIFARDLKATVFQRWASYPRVIIVTETQCSLYGELGPGHATWWDFSHLSKET